MNLHFSQLSATRNLCGRITDVNYITFLRPCPHSSRSRIHCWVRKNNRNCTSVPIICHDCKSPKRLFFLRDIVVGFLFWIGTIDWCRAMALTVTIYSTFTICSDKNEIVIGCFLVDSPSFWCLGHQSAGDYIEQTMHSTHNNAATWSAD